MKKIQLMVLISMAAFAFSACGKSGMDSGKAISTLNNVGTAVESAKDGAKGNHAVRATSAETSVNTAAFSHGMNGSTTTTSAGKHSLKINDASSPISLECSMESTDDMMSMSFKFAPNSSEMKEKLDVQSLEVAVKMTMKKEFTMSEILSGNAKSTGDFKVEIALQQASATLTINAGGEEAKIEATADEKGKQSVKMNGKDMTEEQMKQVQASLDKISNALTGLQSAMGGSTTMHDGTSGMNTSPESGPNSHTGEMPTYPGNPGGYPGYPVR
jgi:hypothetical protein